MIWNQELASGQSKVFVRNSPDGVTWPAPPVQIDGVANGHQWWPDIASTGRVITAVFLDSRDDPAYAPDRPPGNTAEGTNPGPSVHTYIARSRDGGRTWKERRISRQPSTPNYETYLEARLPWYGNRISLSGVPAPASSPPGRTRATWCPATTPGPTAARTASTSMPRAHGPRTPSRDRPSATRRPRLRTRASTRAGSTSTSTARGSAAATAGLTSRCAVRRGDGPGHHPRATRAT